MQAETDVKTAGQALKRRGILAAAGAVMAGIVAKQTSQPAAAAGGTQGTAMIVGANYLNGGANIGTQPTMLFNGTATIGSYYVADAFVAVASSGGTGVSGVGSDAGTGVAGYVISSTASSTAVYGSSPAGVGVKGLSNVTGVQGSGGGDNSSNTTGFPIGVRGSVPNNGYGVYGNAGNGLGVYGVATGGYGVGGDATVGTGVHGQSTSGIGVRGEIALGSTAANAIAVYGVNNSTGANTTGVYGAAAIGNGVVGATYGTGVVAGVYGYSNSAYGVIGSTTAAGYSGLTAITGTPGVAALAATATVSTAFAAYFQGSTVVQGDFAVVGGNKSAAVKDASGQHRLVYCMESPESWFEDFGKGTLVNGATQVTLDKTFTQIAHTDDYGVFLTPEGDSKGLFVTGKTATGFAVREQQGGTSSHAFRWRVVAKRADTKGERLAKFALPKIIIPDESKLPKPVPPKAAPSPLPVTKP